jgi:hypothetical protein
MLTKLENAVLEALRASVEYEHASKGWFVTDLDAAFKASRVTLSQWSGILASLEQKDLYLAGTVKLEAPVIVDTLSRHLENATKAENMEAAMKALRPKVATSAAEFITEAQKAKEAGSNHAIAFVHGPHKKNLKASTSVKMNRR